MSRHIGIRNCLAITLLAAALSFGCNRAEEAKEQPAPAVQSKKIIPPEERDPNRLWCNEHGLYEDECLICHPELANKQPAAEERDPNRLWCNEHGLYEDECLICHPELANKKPAAEERDPNRLWCNEHGLYEDECVICHPELAKKKQASNTPLFCEEHQLTEAECGICRPDHLENLAVGEGLKIRFASDNSVAKAGVETGAPSRSAVAAPRELLGTVSFNRNAVAAAAPLTGGVVLEVLKDVGEMVASGEVLARVQSREVAEVRSELATAAAQAELARKNVARERELHAKEISARRDLEEAEAALRVSESVMAEARQHLQSLGVQGDEGTGATIAVRAPLSGTIIERTAIASTAVEAGTALFEIADLSTMWMEVSVPQGGLAAVQPGTKVQARFDAYPGLAFEGEVAWLAPRVDPQTHMVQARVELANPQGLLKDGLFGRVTLDGAGEETNVTLPSAAVQDIDGRPVVFTKLEEDLYESRLIQTAGEANGRIAVLAGLRPGDVVVTRGSHVVKSELLKARMGAGCTDH